MKISIEETLDGFWAYGQRSPGELPDSPLYEILNWVLEQLSFGHYRTIRDQSGEVISMEMGKRAAYFDKSVDDFAEGINSRIRSVSVAGVFAKEREGGTEPEHQTLHKTVSENPKEWVRRNTEFHYAFELIKVLARLNKKTFKLDPPPVAGKASERALYYLRESTRCWLYGFHGASVALSRSCLEECLKCALKQHDKALDPLIAEAQRAGILDSVMIQAANFVRKAGNDFLHGEVISEKSSREVLDATRSLAEQLSSID